MAKFEKNSQIWLKGFYSLMRWIFRPIDIEACYKSVIETSHLCVAGCAQDQFT